MYKIPAKLCFKSKLVHYLPSCHSTNEIAANLLKEGFKEGGVIITDNQAAGLGQRGNVWETEPYKNLTFSLVLKPAFLPIAEQFLLTQVISISLVQVIQSHISSLVKIKWPNDIYVGNKKIAGILIQNVVKGKEIEHSIIGIGLNVNQINFGFLNATSLLKITNSQVELSLIFREVLEAISKNYEGLKNRNERVLNTEYLEYLFGLDEERKFRAKNEFSGKIIGIDPLGRLLIETSTGVQCFQNQEVEFIF
ncbi:MAG: biotin--[acetyl-CoA-carboxylase] ligase [Cyclobacteriaceae bacterium]|nr:biotin--[acetyl-CoA-carboxylase] ligase [Cyclobacteriaceae bacterium]